MDESKFDKFKIITGIVEVFDNIDFRVK